MIKPIGILGGTFDPIHCGHLRLALEIYQQFNWQQIRFIPCQQPVLEKTAQATAEQRMTMLQLAMASQPGFLVDDRELQRDTPSYTIDTLLSLRAELKETPLCLMIGSDTLADLPRWHRWQELIQLAHIVVVPRPGYGLPETGAIADFIQKHKISDYHLLTNHVAGNIFIADSMTPLNISATVIRRNIMAGFSPRYLLPDVVWDYIQREKLYL